MNTSQPSRLPQAFSPIDPTFASKADYLAFVQEWKAVYRFLGLSLRAARIRSRLRPNNRPEKKLAFETEAAALGARLAALAPCPYVEQGLRYGEVSVPLGPPAATWLIELRAAAKLVAARQRAAALAAKGPPRPEAAP